jgi:hypothetical protein
LRPSPKPCAAGTRSIPASTQMGRQAVAAESPPFSRHRQPREGGPAAASPTRPNASVPCCNLPHVLSLLQMLEDMQQAQGAGGPLKKKRQRSESQKDAAAAEPTRRCAALRPLPLLITCQAPCSVWRSCAHFKPHARP